MNTFKRLQHGKTLLAAIESCREDDFADEVFMNAKLCSTTSESEIRDADEKCYVHTHFTAISDYLFELIQEILILQGKGMRDVHVAKKGLYPAEFCGRKVDDDENHRTRGYQVRLLDESAFSMDENAHLKTSGPVSASSQLSFYLYPGTYDEGYAKMGTICSVVAHMYLKGLLNFFEAEGEINTKSIDLAFEFLGKVLLWVPRPIMVAVQSYYKERDDDMDVFPINRELTDVLMDMAHAWLGPYKFYDIMQLLVTSFMPMDIPTAFAGYLGLHAHVDERCNLDLLKKRWRVIYWKVNFNEESLFAQRNIHYIKIQECDLD